MRLECVDAVRGVAVLWMVWFQTFDFFSRDLNLYGDFWFSTFDYFNWLPIFMTVSGVSLYLMVSKRLAEGHSRRAILVHGLKRYGFYILLSCLLCLWVANLQLFLTFGEVLGAIGLYAIVSLVLLLIFYEHRLLLLFSIYGFSFLMREHISNYYTGPAVSPFFTGFTIWLMLPFYATGIYLADKIKQRKINLLIFFEISLAPFMIFLMSVGYSISYFNGTLPFITINILTTVILFIIFIQKENTLVSRLFSFVGRHALIFYVAHVAIWFKLAIETDTFRTFGTVESTLLTLGSLLLIPLIVETKTRLSTQHKSDES